MALSKGIENMFGISFSYHKLNDVHIIIGDDGIQLRMTVASYVNKEARDEGKQPFLSENIIDGADFALTPFYKLLKAKFADYADAQDVFEDKQENPRRAVYTQQTLQGKLISQREEDE